MVSGKRTPDLEIDVPVRTLGSNFDFDSRSIERTLRSRKIPEAGQSTERHFAAVGGLFPAGAGSFKKIDKGSAARPELAEKVILEQGAQQMSHGFEEFAGDRCPLEFARADRYRIGLQLFEPVPK